MLSKRRLKRRTGERKKRGREKEERKGGEKEEGKGGREKKGRVKKGNDIIFLLNGGKWKV